MARRRTRKKKNPSTAQKIVLGVGGALGLGLVGYGIYLAVKKPVPSLPPDGFGGAPSPRTYQWMITGAPNGQVRAVVIAPNGRRTLGPAVANQSIAMSWVRQMIPAGGVPSPSLPF